MESIPDITKHKINTGRIMSKCEWKDDGEYWEAGCGGCHVFTADGPIENGYKFCPYCGGEVAIEPEQPEILTAHEAYASLYIDDEQNFSEVDMVSFGNTMGIYGQRKLYYQGGYNELVDAIEKAEYLHSDGLKKIHDLIKNLKKPE